MKKEITLKDRMSTILYITVVLLVSIVGVSMNSFIFMFAPLIFMMSMVAVYYIVIYRYIEFEYILVNDELDIDKIVGKRKRKRIITIKKSEIISVGKVGSSDYNEYRKRSGRILEVSSRKGKEDNCYIALRDSKNTLVVMDSNDNILNGISNRRINI